jgi:hypothetical protein
LDTLTMRRLLEVIMPPTDDVEKQLEEILYRFDSNNEDGGYQFFYWYQIGGHWSGHKLAHVLGSDGISSFKELLRKREIKVSDIQSGEPTLVDAENERIVQKLWLEHFPDSPVKRCPLLDNLKNTPLDIMTVASLPDTLYADRVIVSWGQKYEGRLYPWFMYCREFWTGCNSQQTAWGGKVKTALEDYQKSITNCKREWVENYCMKPDWLAVTVEYHDHL